MTQEKVSPLRERMMEDLRIRGMGDKSQKAHIRALKDFSAFLGRSPDTAEPDDLRAYQLHMADTGVTPSTFNARIVALRFFFSMTCDRDGMKKYMQFRTEPRKLPIVLSVEEVSALLAAAPGPGLRARSIGKNTRSSENLHVNALHQTSIRPPRTDERKSRCSSPTSNASLAWPGSDCAAHTASKMNLPSQQSPKTFGNSPSSSRWCPPQANIVVDIQTSK